MRLLVLVDGHTGEAGIVEQHADGPVSGQDRRAGEPPPTGDAVSTPRCSTSGQSSKTVKRAPSSLARRKASRSVSLNEYMIWCSSTIVPFQVRCPTCRASCCASGRTGRSRHAPDRSPGGPPRRIGAGSHRDPRARGSGRTPTAAPRAAPGRSAPPPSARADSPRKPEDQRPIDAPAAAHGRWSFDSGTCFLLPSEVQKYVPSPEMRT